MFAFQTLVAILAATAVVAAPAPSPVKLTGVIHRVVAGRAGLHFDPDNVVAERGDIVEWHFLPKNHSVVQSSFGEPCRPLGSAFFSGFMPIAQGQAPNVFQIVIEDPHKPIWYYC